MFGAFLIFTLALGAIMGAALGNNDAFNRGLASRTGLAGALINGAQHLEVSGRAVGLSIIAHACPAGFDPPM